jgi:hemolysin III
LSHRLGGTLTVFELRDPVSSASHLATAVWAVYATLLMLRLAPPGRRLPLAVYGLSMVLLYLASGTFHGLHFESSEERRFYQKLDQSAIFLLIAGSYTPMQAVLLAGAWRRRLLRAVWGLAVAGITALWLLPEAPHAVVVGLFLGVGWMGMLGIPGYARAVGWRAMNWVWLGAGLYTLGAVCELARWPVLIPGWVHAHEVLHFCDTAATLAYFVFVARYVVPYRETERSWAAGPGRHRAAV